MSELTNENSIEMFMHCRRCALEFKAGHAPRGESMESWSRLSIGWTQPGLQVWCVRHQCNVVHIDFEGHQHPADTTARLDA